MMSLKAPNRPPLSKKIAQSIESVQAVRSNQRTASQPPITHPRRAPPPVNKPVPTSRTASNSDRSSSVSTSQYPTIAATRVAASEYVPLTTSVRARIPSSSKSRLEASTARSSNLYPKLPPPNVFVENVTASTSSNREVLRQSVKGKERQYTGAPIPSLESAEIPSLSPSYAPGFNSPSLTSKSSALPRELSPPPFPFPFHSPPPTPERPQAIHIEPPTPLPPGAFHSAQLQPQPQPHPQPIHPLSKTTSSISLSSRAQQKPLRNPSIEILTSEDLDAKKLARVASPREKVSSALLELSRGLELESITIDLRSPSPSLTPVSVAELVGRKRGRKVEADKQGMGSAKKKVKLATAPRKGKKIAVKEEDEDELGNEEEDEGESTATESIRGYGYRKKAPTALRNPSAKSRKTSSTSISASSQAKTKRKAISIDSSEAEEEEEEFELPVSTLPKKAGRVPLPPAPAGFQIPTMRNGKPATAQELNAASQLRKTLSASTSFRNHSSTATSNPALLRTSTSTSRTNLAGSTSRSLLSTSTSITRSNPWNPLSTSTRPPSTTSTSSLGLGVGVVGKKSIPILSKPTTGVTKKPRRVLLGAGARSKGRGRDGEEMEEEMEGVPLVVRKR